MEWYNYLAAFWAGMFLTNTVPHFVKGVSGDKFPTPFSNPRGLGLSSATVNVLWSFFNLLVGYLLFVAGKIDTAHPLLVATLFAGIAVMSLYSSNHFPNKHKE